MDGKPTFEDVADALVIAGSEGTPLLRRAHRLNHKMSASGVLRPSNRARYFRSTGADFLWRTTARPIKHPVRSGKVPGSGMGVAKKPSENNPKLPREVPTIWPLSLIPEAEIRTPPGKPGKILVKLPSL